MPQHTTPPPKSLPPRNPHGHKGDFGTLAVMGGQAGSTPMIGGPAFSALAAFRTGAGLVRLAMPAPVILAGLALAPSATGVALEVDEHDQIIPHLAAAAFDRLIEHCDCLAIGPGLGVSPGAAGLSLRAVSQTNLPVVVDADALNNLAQTPALGHDFHARAILTPHPGEYARLADSLGIDADAVTPDRRVDAAEQLAQRLGCVVVLKGANTVVTDGQQTWVNTSANSALATAGTGDVLTGVIASLVAQHAKRRGSGADDKGADRLTLFQCACLGVRAHSIAADLWRTDAHADAGLVASELTDRLPRAIQSFRPGARDTTLIS